MKFKSKSDSELLTETRSLVSKEREIKSQILLYLKEFDSRKIYLERGFSSLFSFCMEFLGYTEAEAQRRISACRLLNELPEIEGKIESGELSLTAISQAQSYFKSQNLDASGKMEVLTLLENKSTRQCERELIKLNPEILPTRTEEQRLLTQDHVEIKVILDSKTVAKLEKLKQLFSHEPEMNLPKLIDKMADLMLQKKDLTLKSGRSQKVPGAREVTRYIPAKIRREVMIRDNQECQFQDTLTGRKCRSNFRLQFEHVQPFAKGGKNEPKNLQILCAGHNKLRAMREFGRENIEKYF